MNKRDEKKQVQSETACIPQRILHSKDEAAALLSISTRSLEYLLASGRLKSRKLGGRTLVARDELERFAKSDQPYLVQSAPKGRKALPTRISLGPDDPGSAISAMHTR